jgi:hypothetical protein
MRQWLEDEKECIYLLHRARGLQDAARSLALGAVPSFLEGRVGTGLGPPRVEIVGTQHEEDASARGKRGLAGVAEEECDAMVEYVVTGLNDQLFAELLQGFYP